MNAVNSNDSLASASQHLFLSPHYDDIALSAGATAAMLSDLTLASETAIVFGSEPDANEPLSPFASALHAGWGLAAEAVIASRLAEEHAAAAILGTSTRVLPFHDAIYRGHRYLSDDDLFSKPAQDEDHLPGEIADALGLGEDPDSMTRIYAPLAIGRHVDHQLVFRAAASLAARGWDVWFYEDTPYCLKPEALSTRLAEIGADVLEPAALVSAAPGWKRKIDAIFCYPSQLETIFRQYVGVGTSRGDISEALGAYARAAGAGVLAERFWQMKPARCISGS